jgi:hypothetical protein
MQVIESALKKTYKFSNKYALISDNSDIEEIMVKLAEGKSVIGLNYKSDLFLNNINKKTFIQLMEAPNKLFFNSTGSTGSERCMLTPRVSMHIHGKTFIYDR